MKKKVCWFYHNYQTIVGYRIFPIIGKLLSSPETRLITEVVKCKDCDCVIENKLYQLPSNQCEMQVKTLNNSLSEPFIESRYIFSTERISDPY